MSTQEIRGLETVDALNVIKQKHFKNLDAQDMAFLRANESLLSEADKAMYFDGMSPKDAYNENGSVFLSRNERIIAENRMLQDKQAAEFAAKNVQPVAAVVDEEVVAKEWKDKMKSLNAEADKLEKQAQEDAKAEKKSK